MDSIYTGTLTTRITLPCGSIERFTGNAVLRFGPVRDATVDQNPFFLAIAMDDPNIKLNIASMAITQAWSLAAMPVSNGYNVNGTIIPQTSDGGYNRILGITADAGSRALAKRDFCGATEVYASFANGGASINGPITTTTANVGLSLHAFTGHENPNLQSQFYMQFTGNWDATSAALDTSNPSKPNWPVAGAASSQAEFPTVTIMDTSASASAAAAAVSGSPTMAKSATASAAAGGSKTIGTGPIVGILFAALFVIVAIFLAGRWLLLRHRRQQKIKKASAIPAAGSAAPAFTPNMAYGYNTLHDAETGDAAGRRSVSAEPMLKSAASPAMAQDSESRGLYGSGPHLPEEYSDAHGSAQATPGARGNRDDPFADDGDDADVPRINVSHHSGGR